jgi:hypothetical protein
MESLVYLHDYRAIVVSEIPRARAQERCVLQAAKLAVERQKLIRLLLQ